MNKKIFAKFISYFPQIVALLFIAGFAVYAWTEPPYGGSCANPPCPPGGNVPAPLNASNVGQSKEGGLVLNTGGLPTSNGLIIDKGKICLGANCISSWSEGGGIPSGMIAMFDTSCPSSWTRFAALDNRFPQGAATYGGTGGSLSKTTSGHQHEVPFSFSWDGSYYRLRWQDSAAPFGTGSTVDMRRMADSVWDGFPSGVGRALTSISTPDTISDIRPPYIDVIWCKKN